ncbi:MAG: formate dehydrogenase subunit gamma [Pseudomonadota bacterium]
MTRLIAILGFVFTCAVAAPALAQDVTQGAPQEPAQGADPRASTGGFQTLEDILARQRGEEVQDRKRDLSSAEAQAAALAGQLGTRGGASDADLWSALRYGQANVSVSTGKPEDAILVQDGGMAWYEFREGPLRTYGGYLLVGTLAALLLFFLLRGRIRIDGEKAGKTILRFNLIERAAHWTMAITFILLGLTGLAVLFGRVAIIPVFGHEAFSTIALGSKFIHNWVAWPFMASLVVVFLLWVGHNIPNRHDVVWMLKGGGLFSRGVHPPARKFNAGQKIIFWMVIILGASVSASGLSLLMPFELPMFAKTFSVLNDMGVGEAVYGTPLPTALTPHAEMQLSTVWHAIVAFVMMAVILAHIYLGSVGMEGAFDAMGSGHVDMQWAREHHGLWVKEEEAKRSSVAAE